MVCRAIYKILSLWILVNLLTRIVFATTYTFTDKRGEKIIIDIPIKRAVIVISYELIPALDLWNQVVGVSVWAEKDCDIYKAFIKLNPDFKKPTVGAGINLNIETILKLKPDLIITWTYVPQVVNYLESKGFKVFTIHPDNLAEFYQVLRIYGKLFGKEKKAEETIKEMKKIFNLIKRRITNIPPEKRKKILHLGGKPLSLIHI